MKTDNFDAVVVGAGFAGLYMLHILLKMNLKPIVLEAGSDIGGTWFWNRYPGARCDIESMEYSYQFSDELQQEWEWSERYATQPEILRYLEHVAERFKLRQHIQLNTRVTHMQFNSKLGQWSLQAANGASFMARFAVMSTGCLSIPNKPDIEGLDSFSGQCLHTGLWPHEQVSFTHKKIGVIGTGSSAIQSIPIIAEQAKELLVFQRTPNYSVPAHNQLLDSEYVKDLKSRYNEFRAQNKLTPANANFGQNEQKALDLNQEERKKVYDQRWQRGGLPFLASFSDLIVNDKANQTASDYINKKIRAIVQEPATATKLSSKSIVGCKRMCVDSNYYATYNRPNVNLIDLNSEPIITVTPTGIQTAKQNYDLDMIILATGFDAMTGALLRIDIQGKDNLTLQDAWAMGPQNYLGLAISGFPNLFTVTGPGSPSVLTNMIPSIEHHVDWIADCITFLNKHQHQCIEATPEAQKDWVKHVNEVADMTLFGHCKSWYSGENIPGKPKVFMPYVGFPPYALKCQEVANNSYQGFKTG